MARGVSIWRAKRRTLPCQWQLAEMETREPCLAARIPAAPQPQSPAAPRVTSARNPATAQPRSLATPRVTSACGSHTGRSRWI